MNDKRKKRAKTYCTARAAAVRWRGDAMKWEYKCATFSVFENFDGALQEKLNALGGHGWELVKIESVWLEDGSRSSDCIFKREKPNPAKAMTTDGLAYAMLAPRHTEEEEA